MSSTTRRRWSGRIALAALLAGTTLLAGCYHPHHYRHHRDGWYQYDRDRDHRHHRRHDRRHRDHERECRHGDRCRH
jgi:hypothetical protein